MLKYYHSADLIYRATINTIKYSFNDIATTRMSIRNSFN